MRIFIIDDLEARHATFKKMLGTKHTLTHAYDVKQAMRLIREAEKPFDIALFDHDLQDYITNDNGAYVKDGNGNLIERTGLTLASQIIDELPKEKLPKRVIVHSWNPAGAKRIMTTFLEAGVDAVWDQYCFDMVAKLTASLDNQ